MKTLIGGIIGAALGFIGLIVWWKPFLQLLAGAIPAMLLLGGGLAIYLGLDEMKDTWKKEEVTVEAPGSDEDTEKYKKEIDDLKKEIETLKDEKK
jgi:phosphate/sulfate permease